MQEVRFWRRQVIALFWDFIKLFSSMKILAAEKVSVDGNGLHLVMPSREKFKESVPERPVRREF